MMLTKQILQLLEATGPRDKHSIYVDIDDTRVPDRLALLYEGRYIETVSYNHFGITEKGKKTLRKIL